MKQSFPSLFSTAGFHDITINDIHSTFVEPFAKHNPTRRVMLASKLREYLDALKAIAEPHGLDLEIWIDGSFSTEKVEPNDVDLLVCFQGSQVNRLPEAVQAQLATHLNNNFTKVKYSCDAYACNSSDDARRSYWRGWFMFDRDEQPKGVARIML